jgi:hypothetical protein
MPPSNVGITVPVGGIAIATSIAKVTASTITSGSMLYIAAAKRFSNRAADLDDAGKLVGLSQKGKEGLIADLVDASLAAVLVSNLAVEAILNELFLESNLVPPGQWFKGIPEDVSRALFDEWKQGADRDDVVTKCQLAAKLAGKPPLNFGGGSFQQLTHLIALRNVLVHHKPAVVEHGKPSAESDDDIEKRICRSFPRSQLCDESYPFRWNRCMGAGCARWAYETAVAFERDFFAHLGIGYPAHIP